MRQRETTREAHTQHELTSASPPPLLTSIPLSLFSGHGTHVSPQGLLVATLCGVVRRVDRLTYVKPLRARYAPELGDVVVGRVVEVSGRRWRVDLGAARGAALLLSAVNLPGGALRRRNADDELAMRGVFREGDLLSAEVQAVHHGGGLGDGAAAAMAGAAAGTGAFAGGGGGGAAGGGTPVTPGGGAAAAAAAAGGAGEAVLHTRSAKYGLLTGGQLVVVPATLVRRQKQHMRRLARHGVDVAIGTNGWVWVAPVVGGSAAAAAAAAAEAARAAGGGAGGGGAGEQRTPTTGFVSFHAAQRQADDGSGAAFVGGGTRADGAPGAAGAGAGAAAGSSAACPPPTREQRLRAARVAQAVRAMAALHLPLTADSLSAVADVAVQSGAAPRDMLEPAFFRAVLESTEVRRLCGLSGGGGVGGGGDGGGGGGGGGEMAID
jgi:exosome complex component RRP4